MKLMRVVLKYMMKQKMYSTQFLSMIILPLLKKQKEAVAEEAIENGLLSEAATKTQSTIQKIFKCNSGN